ncbi:vesicle transport protein SEC20 [Phymastichus coffea]|uniref:vesicle transport protein SEC20 n=1 Tax=Phymastichus coffea TaxID=108790 RepID=UPI00273C33C9|nr:vesicle transport protein SEC20 [Phymastichus coffea]
MVLKEETFESLSQEFIKNHLELTALIQDIHQCLGPLEYLNELNGDGRALITTLRNNIDRLIDIVERERAKHKKAELLSVIENYRSQLNTAMAAFRKANFVSSCAIDRLARDELLSAPSEKQNLLRKRKDRDSLAKTSHNLTDRLLDISRHLAETNQRSAETLDTLVISSEKVSGTKKELEQQHQVIVQSGKLLGKYGRREITDKALIFLAFMFFLAVVFYILQKRLL